MSLLGIKKIISAFLIFFLLFSFTLRVPFLTYFSTPAYAGEKEFYNLVSIIVDEDTYSEAKTKLVRYSRDIQSKLEDTRVVILPTPSDASVLDIASLNESLFYEGYKSVKNVDFESRLVGTVLVGKIPVPVVFDSSNSSRSVLPYVDFEDIAYIFDHESQKYQKNQEAENDFSAEIWHGVISPNTGDFDDDITAIEDYFDKNHDFYTGQGVFDQNTGVIDGRDTPAGDSYEPYVFYYDQFRENKALQYQKYVGYQMYLQNLEDITYNRYSKDLAERVKNQVLGIQNQDIQDLLIEVDPDFDISGLSSGPDVNASSDVMTRYITNNATKKFLEIFNSSTLGEMRKYVYNAGRYNESGSKVNVDMPPFLISVLDQVSAQVIKNVNTSLETEITDLVTNGLARDIAIPVGLNTSGNSGTGSLRTCGSASTGFFYGTPSADITNASQCSIYRGEAGSGTLVEANRGYNVNNVGGDTSLCGLGMRYDTTTGTVTQGLTGFWGGNSPVNLTSTGGNYTGFNLGAHNLKAGIRPVFDILGAKEIEDNSKVPSPLDCFQDGVFIQTFKQELYTTGGEEGETLCGTRYSLPIREGDPLQFFSSVPGGQSPSGSTHESRFCASNNVVSTNAISFMDKFGETWGTTGFGNSTCVLEELILPGMTTKTKSISRSCGGEDGCSPCAPRTTYNYNKISSHILHTSPTDNEFGNQTTSLFTPSLPIDKNRYIDFIGANGQGADYGYQRIDFPKLFRITANADEDLTLELISDKLKNHLDEVSDTINNVIRNADPSSLSGTDLELYNVLKTGDYPSANFDLYQILQNKPLEVFTIDNQSKQISYYDTLVFAIYWNNLTTVSSKYKFIFENYLSNQFEGNTYNFHLPKSKKSYETAYFAAPGDAQNMYVKLDPEMKANHPYADVLSKNLELQSVLMASSVATPYSADGAFQCSPPDGVPIWQWIPAVICWLSNMLPPTIKISQGSCGDVTLFLDDDEKEELLACEGDVNKNGINDCIEGKLDGGGLDLSLDAGRYYYHTAGNMTVDIKDKNGELVNFDNISYIDHNIDKVEIPANSDIAFSSTNTEVIYDRNVPSLSTPEAFAQAQKYINFNPVKLRAQAGSTKTFFYTKGEDANVYFVANLKALDASGETVIDLESNIERLQIRGDQMFVESYLVQADGSDLPDNTIVASAHQNMYLIDSGVVTREDAISQMNTNSAADEKLLLSIRNFSQAGNALDLNYPLDVEITREGDTVFSQENITLSNLSSAYPLMVANKSGRYEISITDATGFRTYRALEILPDTAKNLDAIMSTNLVETGGNLSTHLLTILDQFDNAASREIYTVEMSISGGGLLFDTNSSSTITYNIVEGYKAFRLKSTDIEANNVISITLKNISGDIISEISREIQTIEEIKIEVNPLDGNPMVGGGEYKYALSFTDSTGNILTNLNSRVYLVVPSLYGRPLEAYTDVVSGRSEVAFQTSTLAARNIPLEFQLEGGNEIYREYIDIHPEAPIKIDLNLSRDKIEASTSDSTILQAILKDRYNNEVFTDSSTSLNIEIADQSENIIRVSDSSKTVSEGKTQFEISATDIPGIGYFKVSSTPDLGENSFDLIGQAPFDKTRLTIPTMRSSGELSDTGKLFFKEFNGAKYISKFTTQSRLEASQAYKDLPSVIQTQVVDFWIETNKLEVFGIGENAGSVETFFFWDEQDISGSAYNGIYSVLLGAPYGDISKEDYLAGALLFDRDNSSLAVSSLLNTPYDFHDVFTLEKNGLLNAIGSGDITQDIEFITDFDSDGRLTIDINNAALGNYIGKIYYNISDSSDISIQMDSSAGYSVELVGEDAVIKNASGKKIFTAYESGRFERKSGSYVTLDTDYVGEGIRLHIMSGDDRVGSMIVSGDFDINITRNTTLLANKLSSLDDTLIVHLASNQYSTREEYGDPNSQFVSFYYQDPFADKYALDDFHNSGTLGVESIYEEAGIGWEASNTMLLSFSAGESVGDATKDFHSFSLINLGDPVASLKALEFNFPRTSDVKSFDPTVGELIESEDSMIGYQLFDYNNDGREDILTIQTDGYLKLFENVKSQGRFLEQRSLVYAADGGSVRLVKTGDFTGDGYGDVFFVSETGTAELFNNHEKDFLRHDVESQFSLSGSIIQAESFDMDADGNDDIVTLDDAGEIHIFYGGGTAENPVFTKKFIGDGYAIDLSSTTISHGGGVYYDGLVQINPDDAASTLRDTQEYLAELQAAIDAGDDTPAPEFVDESLVNSFLYVSLPYVPTNYQADTPESEILLSGIEEELSSIEGSEQSETLAQDTVSSLSGFLDNYSDYVTYSGLRGGYNTQTYFLRSQYADTEGLEITKSFTDTSVPHLQTGDTVYLDISIKNTSSSRKNNIAYVDSLPKFFNFKDNNFTILTQDNQVVERKRGIGNFNILLDGFYLDPGEETIVRFELVTLPLSYGFMQVGLFEAGEVGDDIYGDIILKEDEKNCGKEADIYRSTSVRSYQKGTTTPTCNAAEVDIGNTFPELTDADGDGVPDYIQNLLGADDGIGNINSPWGADTNPDNISQSDIDAYNQSLEDNVNLQQIQDYGDDIMEELGADSDGDGIPDADDTMDSTDSATDFMGALDAINGAIDDISEDIDELIEGLSCGFGGGSCFANPLNWAPLAPGNDPTLFGMPIGNGLKVNEGIPIFSALTGRQTSCGTSPCCLPSVWPATSQAFVPGPFCGPSSAGGSKGVWSSTNFVRLFATPTLTGGFGIAACFGGPALAAGNSNPMGVHPLVPGGNCIVAAMPLFGCEGGEGDPGILGYPYGNQFGIINANCDGGTAQNLSTPQEIESAFIQDYLEFLRTGTAPATLYTRYEQAFSHVAEHQGAGYSLPSEPLINIAGGGDSSMSTSVELDTSALASGNFQDIIQIKNKRISAFPGFMMDWVERQLDEITSKLTNLPKVFVVLPDFGGIFDFSWNDFGSEMGQAFQKGKAENDNERENKDSQLTALRASKEALDCSGADALQCQGINLKIASVSGKEKLNGAKETLSGIKEVYEFIGNVPLVNVEMETVHVNVPWIDPAELNRFSADWGYTLEQWKDELADAKDSWSLGAACTGTDAEVARCQQENDIKNKAYLDAKAFVGSLEKNIQILEEYKEFPDKLAKLINIKEVWLEQILCNIEAISTLMGEWIGTNGERFKAWVELYMLIKAILKSWQLLIDVFIGYEEECHECKNERQDLQTFIFKLISAVIPSAPIIQFPKWPDIILDLHNVRAGLTIYMPDFEMNLRPIVLPTLPKLHLPSVPDASFSLPALPTLPRFTIPELPDLPTLPTVELPDLPPPPKIPKIFGAVEGILNIMKLVTKIMCILKGSPFVPEWRAGDQIAFLTERNGYLPTDFIDIQPPAFSYSMVSAIKVTTYVNFEFETEFIIEAVRSITAPIDKMSNNIVNMFNISLSDISLVEAVPESIDASLELDGEVEVEDLSLAPLDENPQGAVFISALIAKKAQELLVYIADHSNETVTNTEFKQYVAQQLASTTITSDPATKELQALWDNVYNLSYSKEEKFIAELRENNTEKFNILGDIIRSEIEYSQNQQERLKNLGAPSFNISVDAQTNTRQRASEYNTLLEGYNIKTLKAATQLVSGESQESVEFREEIKQGGEELMQEVRSGLTAFADPKQALLAGSHDSGGTPSINSCNPSGAGKYVYEGIYVLEDGKNYRLFDYVDPLRGDEVPKIFDIDADGDEDVFYMVKGKLYFKENRKNSPSVSHVSTPPLILKVSDNKFYNGDVYYEAVNGFEESGVSDSAINVEFQKPTDNSIHNFRMSYNTIVDRYMDDSANFTPEEVQMHIVDAISDIDAQVLETTTDTYTLSSHLATMTYAGAMAGIKLTTEKLKNIKEDLAANTQVTLTPNTPIYAGNTSFNINYTLSNGTSNSISVDAYKTLAFNVPAEITEISGDAYVSLGINEDITGTDVIDYIGKPLLPGAKISYKGSKIPLDSSSHIDIRYYDGSEIQMDYRDITSYTLYDLGDVYGDDHRIRLEVPNDFYYARIQSFKDDILGTQSRQILLAPQIYSDTLAPQLGLNQRIRIPVYQSQLVDLTPYIYEDGGLSGIAELRVDTDLSLDSDGDGNPKNDANTENMIFTKNSARIAIEFGPYDTLFEKDIVIALVDDNGNIGSKQVVLEVYAPAPKIESIEDFVISGQIDETLLDEPVRLYRYRGGVIEKLQKPDGTDLVETDIYGNYDFETSQTSTGLVLTSSGTTVATIDEYTGKINLESILGATRVLASNDSENESVYPEIQVLFAGNPIFRQFVKMPEQEPKVVASFDDVEPLGTYVKILDQEKYASFRIPLGVPFNPGSVTVYVESDESKTPVMTLFKDGRVDIDNTLYTLEYRSHGDQASLVVVDKQTGNDIAQIVYMLEASYILR